MVDLNQAKMVYEALCAERLKIIRTAMHEIMNEADGCSHLESIRREAHKIRGVAPTFGHFRLGEISEVVEAFCTHQVDGEALALQSLEQHLRQLVEALEQVVASSEFPEEGVPSRRLFQSVVR